MLEDLREEIFMIIRKTRLDVYNLTTNQWSSSPITAPYRSFAMTVLDDKLVTAEGLTKNDEVVRKVLDNGRNIVKCQLLDIVQLLLGIILC